MTNNKYLFKIVILGDSGVGKTSLLEQFINKRYSSHYKSTVGINFVSKELNINGHSVTIQLWDTAGQERFRSLGTAFYRGTDGCVLVFDVSNMKSYESIQTWKDDFLLRSNPYNDSQFPFVLIGNKIDLLAHTLDKHIYSNVIELSNKRIFNNNLNFKYIESSAKEGIDVSSAFYAIANMCLLQDSTDTQNINNYYVSLNTFTKKGSNCFCNI